MLNFEKDIYLENERVKLIPLSMSHFDQLKPFAINEPELWRYSLISAQGEDNLKNYMQKALDLKKAKHSYPFVVFDKKFERFVGSTRFYDYQPTHQTVQLGYTWYGKEYQGTGLNKNCKFLLLAYAFETMQLERVEFRADANNKRSVAAMKSIGCIEEGILRSNCASPYGRRSSVILSILKEEWYSVVKERIKSKIDQEK